MNMGWLRDLIHAGGTGGLNWHLHAYYSCQRWQPTVQLIEQFLAQVTPSSDHLVLIGGSASIAESVEVHEVVSGEMRPKEGGLKIAQGATEVLKPGGNHVMLIGLSEPLMPGDEVTITLDFDNGESVDFTAAVKVVNLDQEHYDSASPSPMKS